MLSMDNDMKTIEERADRAIYEPTDGHSLKACEVVAFARGYELGATEQKAIDEKELLKLESVWVKEAQINHNDVANYKQGYHDAIEKACKWLEKELQEIAVDEVKENFLENNFNIILKSQVTDWLINFRKAMEE